MKPTTAALVPAQIINGRVTYADTGKGVPHARLRVRASQGRVTIPADFETDAEGQFRINPRPADRSYGVWAYPPDGQPYLIAEKGLSWPKGALEQSVDIVLARGVLIQGKVSEEGSGKPVAGVYVDFAPRADRRKSQLIGHTTADGSFQIGAIPGTGCLLITSPDNDYMLREIGDRMVAQGKPGGWRVYSHAYRMLDLKPGVGSQEVNIILHRGLTVSW